MNSAFALFEIIFTRINPAPWIHLLWLVIILILYLGLAYITYATKHYFVYSFLNFNPPNNVIDSATGKTTNIGGVGKGAVVGYVFGIAVAICLIFCLVRGLVWARKWVTEKKLGMRGKFFAGREMGAGDVELETQRVWENKG